MDKLSTGARQELVQAMRVRDQSSPAEAKGQILDEFVAVTGYHRKHVLRLLNGRAQLGPSKKRGRSKLYDEAVHQALGSYGRPQIAYAESDLSRYCPFLFQPSNGTGISHSTPPFANAFLPSVHQR